MALIYRVFVQWLRTLAFHAGNMGSLRVLYLIERYIATGTFSPVILDPSLVSTIRQIKSKQAETLTLHRAIHSITRSFDRLSTICLSIDPVDMNLVQSALFKCLTSFWRKSFEPQSVTVNAEEGCNCCQRWCEFCN